MTGLRLNNGDDHTFVNPSILVGPTKRSRASHRDMLNPCCQVEGCNLDLKSAKSYHRRHRICESHSKSPRVVVAGFERRFCQQCSRFHALSEFDEKKRSCRRRLSDHNARRRRAQPESVQLLSSALYDERRESLLLEGLPVSNPNSGWEDGDAYVFRQRYSDQVLDQRLRIPATPGMINAQSFLSSSSWGSNEGQSTTIQQEPELFKEADYE